MMEKDGLRKEGPEDGVQKLRANPGKEKEESEGTRMEARGQGETPVLVYIGPSFPGVKRYTVYNNGLPDGLEKKVQEAPVFQGLVIPVQNLAQANTGLMEKGSAIHTMYREAEKHLKEDKRS